MFNTVMLEIGLYNINDYSYILRRCKQYTVTCEKLMWYHNFPKMKSERWLKMPDMRFMNPTKLFISKQILKTILDKNLYIKKTKNCQKTRLTSYFVKIFFLVFTLCDLHQYCYLGTYKETNTFHIFSASDIATCWYILLSGSVYLEGAIYHPGCRCVDVSLKLFNSNFVSSVKHFVLVRIEPQRW